MSGPIGTEIRVIDHGVDQSTNRRRRWNDVSGAVAVGPKPAPVRRHGAAAILERAAWLALLPVYFVMAVVVTLAYAVAVLVVDVRSWLRNVLGRG